MSWLELADLYAEVYNAPPWNESWNRASALEEMEEVITIKGFYGVTAKNFEGKIIGFSWGYILPEKNTSRVDFLSIRKNLELFGIDSNKVFYGAETGVGYKYRKRGIGARLVVERTRVFPTEVIIFRTKNPEIVNVYRRLFGEETFSFNEESNYAGGKIYVFNNKILKDLRIGD